MKRLLLTVFVMLLALPAFSKLTWDHLQPPVNLPDEAKYDALLKEKLCLTPFDCGRVVSVPPFGYGEHSLSVYSGRQNNDSRYYVTYAEASDSLRDWTDAGHHPEKAEHVKIRRADVEIPSMIAILIKQVWAGMLSDVQAMRVEDSPDYVWGESRTARFSIQLSPTKTLYGETPIVPDRGKKVAELLQLTESLREYCRVEMAARPTALKKIEQEVKRLVEDLKNK